MPLQEKKVHEEQPLAPPWSPPAPAVPAPPVPVPQSSNFHHKGDSVQQLKGAQHRVHYNPDSNYHHQQYGMQCSHVTHRSCLKNSFMSLFTATPRFFLLSLAIA